MAIQTSRRQLRLVLVLLIAVVCCSRCGDGEEKNVPPSSIPSQPMDAAQVKKLYYAKCGICHGEDGKLNYAGAKDLSISSLTKEAIAAQIKYGKGTMPPQKDILTDDEMNALAEFSLSLRIP